jgi:(4S)-4-hydroxy-5-phosphonooxypentane-2,3-dione isomerase
MIVTCVHVFVKPSHLADFIAASTANHKESIKEPGNLRFDLLQLTEDETQFMIYEAYDSEASAAAHKETEHYKTWRETVAPFMAQDRQGIRYNIVAPADKQGWGK